MSQVTLSSSTAASFTREAFTAHLARVQHLPAWWLDRKRAAYERYLTLPMPARTNEGWRFSNISADDTCSPSVFSPANLDAGGGPTGIDDRAISEYWSALLP